MHKFWCCGLFTPEKQNIPFSARRTSFVSCSASSKAALAQWMLARLTGRSLYDGTVLPYVPLTSFSVHLSWMRLDLIHKGPSG